MSRRQELSEFLECGHLRDCVMRHAPGLSADAADLLVDIVSRYCEPRRRRRRVRPATQRPTA